MNKDKLLAALKFMRLVGDDGTLSLTNIAVLAALGKLLVTPAVGMQDIAMFIGALISYQTKRFLNGQPDDKAADVSALKEQVAKLQTATTSLQIGAGMKPR